MITFIILEKNIQKLSLESNTFSVCLVWRQRKLILIELSLRELILIKNEFDVN